MRIRKHAKISPLLYASSSLKTGTVVQTLVCQLNQSPWDVMTFSPPDPSSSPPPPAFLVDKDRSYLANGFSSDHIAADESPKWDDFAAGEGFDYRGTKLEQEGSLRLKKEEDDNIFCSKINGNDRQCRKRLKNEQSFCEHHLAQTSVKKSENRRRARPKKPASSANPYEFYYYSGFGPRWGKKRGAGTRLGTGIAIKEEPYNSHDSCSSEASTKNINSSDNNMIIEVDADEGPITPEPSVKSSQFDEQVLDYVEHDEDDDDDENIEMGRKRGRKPIKARSLKSLM